MMNSYEPPFFRNSFLTGTSSSKVKAAAAVELASDCKSDSNKYTVSMSFEQHYYHALVGVVNQSGRVCGECV